MTQGKYILVDGSFCKSDEYRITSAEAEALHFSQKFRVIRSKLPFFAESLELIRLKLLYFNQTYPEFTSNDGAALLRQIERTLTKNKHFLGAVVKLTFRFIASKVHYTIQSEVIEPVAYEINTKGLYTEIITPIQKSISSLAALSLGSEIYWDIASCHKKESTADELLTINTLGNIIEAPESNIYLILGNQVIGVGANQGAYQDITKPEMLSIFEELNLKYTEDIAITEDVLRSAEELMLVNSIKGVQWIIGFEEKRYFNHTTRKINELFQKRRLS